MNVLRKFSSCWSVKNHRERPGYVEWPEKGVAINFNAESPRQPHLSNVPPWEHGLENDKTTDKAIVVNVTPSETGLVSNQATVAKETNTVKTLLSDSEPMTPTLLLNTTDLLSDDDDFTVSELDDVSTTGADSVVANLDSSSTPEKEKLDDVTDDVTEEKKDVTLTTINIGSPPGSVKHLVKDNLRKPDERRLSQSTGYGSETSSSFVSFRPSREPPTYEQALADIKMMSLRSESIKRLSIPTYRSGNRDDTFDYFLELEKQLGVRSHFFEGSRTVPNTPQHPRHSSSRYTPNNLKALDVESDYLRDQEKTFRCRKLLQELRNARRGGTLTLAYSRSKSEESVDDMSTTTTGSKRYDRKASWNPKYEWFV